MQGCLLSTALVPLGVPLLSPALPSLARAFAVSGARASLFVSAYFLTGIVLAPVIGGIVSRTGRRSVLVASLAGFALVGVAVPAAPSFDVALALRALQGTAAAGVLVATVTFIGSTFEGRRRNAVLGANAAALAAGAAVYPVLGGALLGVSWRAPFLAFLLALPAAAFAWFVFPDDPGETGPRPRLQTALSGLPATDAVALYGATFVGEFLLVGAVFTLLPFLLVADYALAPVFVGGVITATLTVTAVAAASNGRLSTVASNAALLVAGFASIAAGLFGAWVARSAAPVATSVTLVGLGTGLNYPSIDAELSTRVEPAARSSVLSARVSWTFLGRTLGPAAFAWVALRYDYGTSLLAGGVLAAVTALVVAALSVRR